MSRPKAPPGERIRPAGGPDGSQNNTATTKRRSCTVTPPDDVAVPLHRPWARRPDAHDVEVRFRRDRDGWRRRIDCARRTSHDGADPVAPYCGGRWTS
jgi:hypothetical protein